ncbi:hypothetical protein NDA11_007401 [Ustilago hordei]|uniref:Uncharacterized protein n=1 Tax=Ustilago hordei TaxID=120017 RepID=I2FSF1_USTHO|nr:uncharacterized protein UHO2_05760 [Ustilago hordei]KAJ1042060.1 hypothetical protein NDA10_004634 [Ustilago hordei]KAJ1573349.1 hypothetical protein NDA15_005444 [Ustilago hordei]KAJ1574844.1 hypothetical protein NDA12_006729 [Ustilago hordei]KAJ1576781.1 hypothetical protein NDA11_007401 [Ustilago hordei]KAJ1596420.1 hypothetical protein NDA14_007679 [Ustilago hordei]
MSLLRTSTNLFSTVRVGASASRSIATSAVRRTDDPNILNKDTHSGASVKADKHSKDPKTLQKETAQASEQRGAPGEKGIMSGSPNDVPTQSEDAVHGEKHEKSPGQLQKETVGKLHN